MTCVTYVVISIFALVTALVILAVSSVTEEEHSGEPIKQDITRQEADARPSRDEPREEEQVAATSPAPVPEPAEEVVQEDRPVAAPGVEHEHLVPEPAPEPRHGAEGVWDRLAQCESGGDWHINTGNGYSGGVQFHPQTWTGHGGGEFAQYAWQATREQQIAIAERVLVTQGWGAWPTCSKKMGFLK